MGAKSAEFGPIAKDLANWLHNGLLNERGKYDQDLLLKLAKALKQHPTHIRKLAAGEKHFRVDEIPKIAKVIESRVPPSARW